MKIRFVLLLSLAGFCSSCAFWDNTVEVSKTIWGSTTRALNNARDRAITKTYNKPYWDCVRSSIAVIKKKTWVIFQKNEIKGFIVVMGIKGNVNTTEIGIFFDELSDTRTKIEVASLSTSAKRKVAGGLFHGLDIAFGLVPPDLPPKPVLKPKPKNIYKANIPAPTPL